MSIELVLRDVAGHIVQKKHEAALIAQNRLMGFRHQIGTNYQCPRCWINEGTQAALVGCPGTSGEDIYRCEQCGTEYG